MSDLPKSSSSELDWIDVMLLEDWEQRWTDSGMWGKPNGKLPSYRALVTDNVVQLSDSPVHGSVDNMKEFDRPITPPAVTTDALPATQPLDKPAPPLRNHKSSTRKPCIHWSKEEHEQFLMGLRECKYDWRSISERFVKTRTQIQVSTHAQNYFLHHSKESNNTTGKKRKSIHDLTIPDLDDKKV